MEEEKVSEAFNRFSKEFSSRKQSHYFNIQSILIGEGYSIDEKNRNRILARLKRLIESQIIKRFKENIYFVSDRINCDIYSLKPRNSDNNYIDFMTNFSCQRPNARCSLPEFITENEEYLEEIVSSKSESKCMKEKTKETCQDILTQPNKIRGKQNCSRLGDFIIYLECPDKCILLTYDEDFDCLNEVLHARQVERMKYYSN